MSTKMFVIVTYDVVVKRNAKVLKECRKYLTHVQKSVFEGFIDERQLQRLKNTLQKLIDPENDQVAIYRYGKCNRIEKEVIGYHMTQSNVI